MSQICPVCNGLHTLQTRCPRCQRKMEDWGQLASFFDAYSPYEENELLDQSEASVYEGFCQHVAYCRHCQLLTKAKVLTQPT